MSIEWWRPVFPLLSHPLLVPERMAFCQPGAESKSLGVTGSDKKTNRRQASAQAALLASCSTNRTEKSQGLGIQEVTIGRLGFPFLILLPGSNLGIKRPAHESGL